MLAENPVEVFGNAHSSAFSKRNKNQKQQQIGEVIIMGKGSGSGGGGGGHGGGGKGGGGGGRGQGNAGGWPSDGHFPTAPNFQGLKGASNGRRRPRTKVGSEGR